MKFSVQWLCEQLQDSIEVESLASVFTMSGLEVESLEPAAGEFNGVVVGEILSEAMHPDAKRLHCCQVNIGQPNPLSIVCGGINVRPGLKVALATVGAHLPGGIEIKQGLLRGEPSHGMICSAKELQLGEDKEGCILELSPDAPVGQDLRQYLKLNDSIMDIALTANRGDCLSINGLARESAALLHKEYKPLKINPVAESINDSLPVHIEAGQRCPRYLGRVIRNINHSAVTPVWMQERLRRSGVRSIHPVVDVTNYVMLELGQPMHAFNLENIDEEITVRLARSGETLTLLDGRLLELSNDDLVIADRSQSLALAGIMGGVSSAVCSNTCHLFLESAFFAAIPLSLTARRHSLQTDSSYRFARGVDYELTRYAMERATQLLLEIVGGKAGPIIEKTDVDYLPKTTEIFLRSEQIPRLLGIDLTDQQITDILQSLGMIVTLTNGGWQVAVPGYRYDLTLEVDLIEELGRLYGYQKIPLQSMNVAMQTVPAADHDFLKRLLLLLNDRGYSEAITYSFINPKIQNLLDPEHKPIALANPISSDLSVMRTSLWPGLLEALKYNQNRQIPRVRLFEYGLCFLPPLEQPRQIKMLAGVISGEALPEQWGAKSRMVDFFDIKGDLEALFALIDIGKQLVWRPAQHPALHPGQSAEVLYENQVIAYIGALHPALAEKCEVSLPVYLFELRLDLMKDRQSIEFKEFSKFPGIRRDLAVTLPQEIPAAMIEKFIFERAGKLLHNVQTFDVYQGQNIEKGQKSIALALNFQDASRTLKDEEIQTIIDDLIKGLEEKFNAKLRV